MVVTGRSFIVVVGELIGSCSSRCWKTCKLFVVILTGQQLGPVYIVTMFVLYWESRRAEPHWTSVILNTLHTLHINVHASVWNEYDAAELAAKPRAQDVLTGLSLAYRGCAP
jgi:hypothetical protein